MARPGYYSVLLKDYGIKAELTATKRVGFHRYTFPATQEANLLFNIGTRMGESGPVRDASVTYTDDGRIEGWVVTEPVYVDAYQKGAVVTMYFSAVRGRRPHVVRHLLRRARPSPGNAAARVPEQDCTCVSTPVNNSKWA